MRLASFLAEGLTIPIMPSGLIGLTGLQAYRFRVEGLQVSLGLLLGEGNLNGF